MQGFNKPSAWGLAIVMFTVGTTEMFGQQFGQCSASPNDVCATPATAKVGIGLDSNTPPTVMLDVKGDANNAQRIRITNGNTGSSAFASLNLVTDAGANVGAFFLNTLANHQYGGKGGTLPLDNASDNAVAIATHDQVRMWIDHAGLGGTGTTAPAYPLDVAGTIHGTNVIPPSQDVGGWFPASTAMSAGTVVVLNPA